MPTHKWFPKTRVAIELLGALLDLAGLFPCEQKDWGGRVREIGGNAGILYKWDSK